MRTEIVGSLWSVLWVGALSLLPARGDVRIFRRNTHEEVASFDDAASLFGPIVPVEGIRGVIVYSSPPVACSDVVKPPSAFNYGNWILLIQRGNCSFEEKVRHAQSAGYNAVIVHNVDSNTLEPMRADNTTGIFIPSVFIGAYDAELIRRYYFYNSSYYACITHDLPFDITIHMLLIFSILVGLCFLGMVVFIVIKFFKDRRRQQRHRLPKSSLKQIPILKFKKNDPYETCVICLEDYVEGEKLRVLPCMHAYHVKCIDPWLTKNRRVCPVCKRKVTVGNQPSSDGDTDSEDETQPLLRGAPSSSNIPAQSDNVSGNENRFQRARRHFLGLAESVASSISSTNSSSSGASQRPHTSSIHSVTVDVEDHEEDTNDTRSLIDEPSVNA